MTNEQLKQTAEKADMIVSGYAFTSTDDGFIRVLNLNAPDCAMVVNTACEMIETNMDEIEQEIVLDICRKRLRS